MTSERRPYSSPTLTRIGSVRDLTACAPCVPGWTHTTPGTEEQTRAWQGKHGIESAPPVSVPNSGTEVVGPSINQRLKKALDFGRRRAERMRRNVIEMPPEGGDPSKEEK